MDELTTILSVVERNIPLVGEIFNVIADELTNGTKLLPEDARRNMLKEFHAFLNNGLDNEPND